MPQQPHIAHPAGDCSYPVLSALLGESRFGRPALIFQFQTGYGPLTCECDVTGEKVARTIKGLRAMGWKGTNIAEAAIWSVGKTASLWIKHQDSKKPGGRPYVNVYLSDRAAPVAYTPDVDEAYAAQLEASIKAIDAQGEEDGGEAAATPPPAAQPATAPTTAPAKAPMDDDDIPF